LLVSCRGGPDGGEDCVGSVAATVPEIVAAHAVLGFQMTDHGFDGGPAAQLALDPRRHASLLAGDEDPELVIGRRVVAAVPLVGEDALENYGDSALNLKTSSISEIASAERQLKALDP
jgi:hypothetical protein